MKSSLLRLCGVFLLSAWATAMAAAGEVRLFQITRSLNRNIVCYDARLTEGGLDTKQPIHVYWINHEERPGARDELSMIQRKLAFGYNVKSANPTEAVVYLTAYNKRAMHVRKHGGKWVATTTINGVECILTEIYAKAKNAMTVEYIELRGKAISNGSTQKETLKP